MSGISLVKDIIKQTLGNIRSCRTLLHLRLKTDPYIPSNSPIIALDPNLEHQEKKAEKMLLQYQIQPPILTCNLLANTLVLASGAVGEQDNYLLMKSFQRVQEWADDSIRELNEADLEEKQVRELLIGTRNSLEECSEGLKADISPSSHHKVLDFLL